MTDTITIHKGVIKGFHGSWGGGMGLLTIEDSRPGTVESVPCDNGSTVRALDAAFGDVIGNSHDVRTQDGHIGQEIYWSYDEIGLCLGGFMPVAEADPELEEKYESQF